MRLVRTVVFIAAASILAPAGLHAAHDATTVDRGQERLGGVKPQQAPLAPGGRLPTPDPSGPSAVPADPPETPAPSQAVFASGDSGVFSLSGSSLPVPAAVLTNPNVDGVALRQSWSDIETSDGHYDWSFLDSQVPAIVAAGKSVSISIMVGEGTPPWVFAAGARSFSTIVLNPGATDFCQTIQIAVPWDPVFLAKWTAFIKAMGAHYATKPIGSVHLTGLNDQSQETTLPSHMGEVVNGCTSNDDVQEWESLGYSGARIKAAWTQIVDTFAAAFPHSKIIPMVLPNSFPPIDDAGHLNPAWTNLQNTLVEIGVARHSSQFGVQNNALSDYFIMPLIQSLASSMTTGFQMLWWVTNDTSCRLNGLITPCDPHTELQQAVATGLNGGAAYLEIYQTDIVNPALADVIVLAHTQLRSQAFQFSVPNYGVVEGTPNAVITVQRIRGSTGTASIHYGTSDGTATAGLEYQAASGTLTFGPGVVSRTFFVPIINDTLQQPTETALLNLSSPSAGTILGSQSTAVLTIADNDVAGHVQFSVSGYSVSEGGLATITVTRTGGAASGVSVAYATSAGTATPGTNYTETSGVLLFGAGVTSQTFTVQTKTTGTVQANLTVNLALFSPTGGASLGTPSSAVLTILEDNPVFQFSTPAYTVSESSPSALITVVRSGSSAGTASVGYATADGTAKDGVNYTHAAGTLTFGPGVVSRSFSVPIVNDTLYQPTLTVLLSLSNPSAGAALGTQSAAVLSITDNDVAGTLSLSSGSYTVAETGVTATITVRRTGGAASGVTAHFATADGTALAGRDYVATSGLLTFGPGVTSQTFLVAILNDPIPHADRSLSVVLRNPGGGGTLGTPSTATLTIQTDDPVVQFSSSAYTVAEKGKQATIAVTRSRKTTVPVSVQFQTSDGTATSPADYASRSGTLNFGAGVLVQSFTVPVSDDAALEGAETVNLALSNPSSGAVLGTQQTAVLTITTDDATMQFSAAGYSVSEASAVATITVTRTVNTTTTASIAYATTSGGTAIDGQNYLSTAGTLTFGPGVASKTFAVPILDNLGHQGPRTVNLALSSPSGGLLGATATAVLTIADVDTPGTLQFSAGTFSVSEAAPVATITVTRLVSSASNATVDFATSDGTATAGVNYVSASGTLEFAAGQSSVTFLVPMLDDHVSTGNQTVNLTLSNPTGLNSLGAQSTATLWIVEQP
jgi:hypothetical protein